MKKNTVLFSLLLFLCASIPFGAFAQLTSCPVAGNVPITDRALARLTGIPDSVQCWDPSDPTTGSNVAQAKSYLLSIARNLRNSQAPPDAAHIAPLNASFAVCAERFLKAYKDNYGPVYVVSAFRCGPRSPASLTCDRTENQRAGGATNSNHQIGVAMDINPAGGNSSYDTLKSFAQANPGYGMNFPWPFYDGSIDKPHMQATNTMNPSCTGVSGTPVRPGNGVATPPIVSGPTPAQTTALSNAVRGMLVQPPPPVIPSQPIAPMYNPTQYFTPPPVVSPTPPPVQPPPISPTQLVVPPPISNLFSVPPDYSPATSTRTPTTSEKLINGIGNVSTLYDANGKPRVVGTSTVVISSKPETTFKSDDLNKSPMQAGLFKNQNPLFVVLETLKQVLLKLLTVIKPFGRQQSQTSPQR